jgi:hypothetical protein
VPASSLAHSAWYGAEISSRQWRTDRGLRVGESVARLRTLYPRASRHRASWWLATKEDHIVPGRREATLVAVERDARVMRFVVPPAIRTDLSGHGCCRGWQRFVRRGGYRSS